MSRLIMFVIFGGFMGLLLLNLGGCDDWLVNP